MTGNKGDVIGVVGCSEDHCVVVEGFLTAFVHGSVDLGCNSGSDHSGAVFIGQGRKDTGIFVEYGDIKARGFFDGVHNGIVHGYVRVALIKIQRIAAGQSVVPGICGIHEKSGAHTSVSELFFGHIVHDAA